MTKIGNYFHISYKILKQFFLFIFFYVLKENLHNLQEQEQYPG